ncbi:MAG: M1 family aminopeptidase [Candidatus Ozemobacteraceae bacterium]
MTQQTHLKMLVLTVPKNDFQHPQGLIDITVAYKNPNFYGTNTNPEDMKPFSIGQITRTNSFNSHMYPYPFIPFHSAKAADIFISTNLKDGIAISSGKLLNIVENSEYKTFHYHTDQDSGELPYPFAIAAYQTLEVLASDGKTTLQLFFFPEDRVFAEQRLPAVQKMFSNYLELFGEYPFPKLAVVEIAPNEGTIGLAVQSVVFLSQKHYFGSKLNETDMGIANDTLFSLADEINHQWNFYKIHSPTYLAEGISRYSDSLTAECFGGSAALTDQMIQTTKNYLDLIENGNVKDAPITDPEVFPALYFLKGSMALHMLRGMFGFEEFKTAMRFYFRENEGKFCDLKELQIAFEKVTKTDLSWFFSQWFEKSGWPKVKMQFWIEQIEGNKYSLKITVQQKQESLFRLDNVPLQVEEISGKKRTFYFNLKPQKSQNFEFKLENKPKDVVLDPDGWVLKEMID